jgi:hypothetical protein
MLSPAEANPFTRPRGANAIVKTEDVEPNRVLKFG